MKKKGKYNLKQQEMARKATYWNDQEENHNGNYQ